MPGSLDPDIYFFEYLVGEGLNSEKAYANNCLNLQP